MTNGSMDTVPCSRIFNKEREGYETYTENRRTDDSAVLFNL